MSEPLNTPILATKNSYLVRPPADVPLADFKAVVVAAALLFSTNSLRPTALAINSICTSLPIAYIEKIIATDEFASEMYRNGVLWDTHRDVLSTRQLSCLLEIANPLSGRSLAARLKAAGVSHKEYAIWKKNPVFSQKLAQLTDDLLEQSKPELRAALLQLGLEGKLDAIKYIDEITGATASLSSKNDAAAQRLMDMRTFVQTVLEIVQSEVTDPAALSRIASRVQLALASTSSVPSAPAVGPNIPAPSTSSNTTRQELLEVLR